MSGAASARRGGFGATGLLGALVLVANLAALSGAATRVVAPPNLATPLATSLADASASWAAMPMGHLDQPLNTFWQLFYRSANSAHWSDVVSGTAVATNGGLVLSGSEGLSLLVGVRPSNLLTFSPVLTTPDGGRTWSPGPVITESLAARPDALAGVPGGASLALVSGKDGPEVLRTGGAQASWSVLTSERSLAASAPGRACGLQTITAVGEDAGTALVAGECNRPGVVGLFSERSGVWHLAGPSLPVSLAASVEVMGLRSASSGLGVLLALSGTSTSGSGPRLLGATRVAGSSRWTLSPPLLLGAASHVVSFGPSTGLGMFVLSASSAGQERLAVLDDAAQSWRSLPAPPAGTETVVFGSGGQVDALAASGKVMTDYTLSKAAHWSRAQRLDVAIQYGSSS